MNERECDFLVDQGTIEAGGRTKARKGADIVVRDNIELSTSNVLPMWMLGLEY